MSTIQERTSVSTRNGAISNGSFGNGSTKHVDAESTISKTSSSRFSGLRKVFGAKDEDQLTDISNTSAVPRLSKGVVLEVIPDKVVPEAVLMSHFRNAARRMKEFRDMPKPAKAKSNVVGNLKDSIFGTKEGAVVKGEVTEDGSKVRITPEDALLWRRLQLRAIEKERFLANTRRGLDIVKERKERLRSENKEWQRRVDWMHSFQERQLREVKATVRARTEEASLRYKSLTEERVDRLNFRDKVRLMKVEKIEAGRRIEQRFLKKYASQIRKYQGMH